MNDEFAMDKITIVGSEGNECVRFDLEFNYHQIVIDEMSFDELKRLSLFLNEYIKREGGEQ